MEYINLIMPKLPIWTTIEHNLQLISRQNSSSKLQSLNIQYAESASIIYIDQAISVFSLIEKEKTLKYPHIRTQERKNICIIYTQSVEQNNTPLFIQKPVYNCIRIKKDCYYLFTDNLSGRYQIIEYNSQQNQFTEIQIKDIKPLRKIQPIFQFRQGQQAIYLCSNKTIHEWEITSSVWKFLIQNSKWEQVQMPEESKRNFKNVQYPWILYISGIFYLLQQQLLIIVTHKGLKEIQLEGLKIDNQKDFFTYYWNDNEQSFDILIFKHQPDEKILLKLTRNSIQRIDLGIVLGIEDITKQSQFLSKSANSFYFQTKKKNKSGITTDFNFNQKYFINKTTIISRQNAKFNLSTTDATILYTVSGIIKNQTFQVKYYEHIIETNKLRMLDTLSSSNISLIEYFQNKKYKGYADLILITEKKEVMCSRQLFQYYSPKFKKLYLNSNNSKNLSDGPTNVRLDHAKLHTVYFLVQQLYYQFAMPLTDLDQTTILDLMILAQKFQIKKIQSLCQSHVEPSIQNFPRLYDYIRNAESTQFKEQLIRFFVIHTQQLIKMMPIGKIQQLIRLMYAPQCQHTNWTEIRTRIDSKYQIKSSDNPHSIQYPKYINYLPFIKNQEIDLQICQKCHTMLENNENNHRKKHVSRSNFSNSHAEGYQNNHKKDNNSS